MSDATHFDLVPIAMDPETKSISAQSSSRALAAELEQLNLMHRALLTLENPSGTPPPPVPVNPKRTAQVNKLREQGNMEFKKAKYIDAVRCFTLGIVMAVARPFWEPSPLVREEVSALLGLRAQAQMALQNWPEAMVDAEASVEAKRMGNAKAWWRKGKCLAEMGRLDEAREWVKKGLEVEGEEEELKALLKEIEGRIEKGV